MACSMTKTLFFFGLIALVYCGDGPFACGSFTSSNPTQALTSPITSFDKSNHGAGNHWPHERLPFQNTQSTSGTYVQMSGGRFAWINANGNGVAVSVGSQAWYTLGQTNGIFSRKSWVKFPPPSNFVDYSLAQGSISSIAASGDFVAVCGTFNYIGDPEYGQPVEAPQVSNTDFQGTLSQTSIAVFQLTSGSTDGASSGKWTIVWPQSYNNNLPAPMKQVTCSSLWGWGTQGNFLIDEEQNPFITWRIKGTGVPDLWAGSDTTKYSKLNSNWKSYGENTYIYALNLQSGINDATVSKRSSSESAWTKIVSTTTTPFTPAQTYPGGGQVAGLANRFKDYVVDGAGNLYALIATAPYVDGFAQTNGENDQFGQYVWKLPAGSSTESAFVTISNDRFANNLNGLNLKLTDTDLAIGYDAAQDRLLVFGKSFLIKAKERDIARAPYKIFLVQPLGANQFDSVDPLQSYLRDNFIAKPLNGLAWFNATTTSFDIAYGGGFKLPPSLGSIRSLAGESKSYFITSNTNVGYNWYTPNVLHHDEKSQWQNFPVLPLGVDTDPFQNRVGYVSWAAHYKEGYLVAGSFRSVDFDARYSLFWISEDGATVKKYDVRNTAGSSGRFTAYRRPGAINAAVLNGDWLIVGGTFDWVSAGTQPGQYAQNIAALNLKEEKWSTMDMGAIDGSVNALVWTNGRIYAGGSFKRVGNLNAPSIAAFKPISSSNYTCCWETLNQGLSGTVNYLQLAEDGLIAASTGLLNPSGSTQQNYYMAKWNWKYWQPFDFHWDTECNLNKGCNLPNAPVDWYAMNGFYYAADGQGNLYQFDGARFRTITDQVYGAVKLSQDGTGKRLLAWGSSATTSQSGNQYINYVDPEWSEDDENAHQSVAGSNVVPMWVTPVDDKVSASGSLVVPVFTLVALLFTLFF